MKKIIVKLLVCVILCAATLCSFAVVVFADDVIDDAFLSENNDAIVDKITEYINADPGSLDPEEIKNDIQNEYVLEQDAALPSAMAAIVEAIIKLPADEKSTWTELVQNEKNDKIQEALRASVEQTEPDSQIGDSGAALELISKLNFEKNSDVTDGSVEETVVPSNIDDPPPPKTRKWPTVVLLILLLLAIGLCVILVIQNKNLKQKNVEQKSTIKSYRSMEENKYNDDQRLSDYKAKILQFKDICDKKDLEIKQIKSEYNKIKNENIKYKEDNKKLKECIIKQREHVTDPKPSTESDRIPPPIEPQEPKTIARELCGLKMVDGGVKLTNDELVYIERKKGGNEIEVYPSAKIRNISIRNSLSQYFDFNVFGGEHIQTIKPCILKKSASNYTIAQKGVVKIL